MNPWHDILPYRQLEKLKQRSGGRFNGAMPSDEKSFDAMAVEDRVFVVTISHKTGFVPPDFTRSDVLRRGLGGWYDQEVRLVTLVRTALVLDDDQIVVELEQPTMLSHRNGPTQEADFFVFCRDKTVRYLWDDEVREWTSNVPTWDWTKFPVVAESLRGLD